MQLKDDEILKEPHSKECCVAPFRIIVKFRFHASVCIPCPIPPLHRESVSDSIRFWSASILHVEEPPDRLFVKRARFFSMERRLAVSRSRRISTFQRSLISISVVSTGQAGNDLSIFSLLSTVSFRNYCNYSEEILSCKSHKNS